MSTNEGYSVREFLNERVSPGNLPDLMKKLRLGDLFAGSVKFDLRKTAPAADAAQLATLHQVGLPDWLRASAIHRSYARAGTATAGELSVKGYGVTPQTGEVAVAPNGDIALLAADAWTSLDVEFMAVFGSVVELTGLPVSSNAVALPTPYTDRGVIYLIDANATEGTVTGRKIITVPAASGTATKACLNLAKTSVLFHADDAVTKCNLKLFVAPELDTRTILGQSAV